METFSIIITTLLVCLGVVPFIGRFIKFIRFKRLIDRVPGPKSYPLIGTAHALVGLPRHQIFNTLSGFRKQFPGGIYRLWHGLTPEIKIFNCEYAEQIFKSSKIIDKSYAYNFMKPWLGEGLLIATGPKWFKHRKIITPTFYFSVLENFCTVFGENCKVLIEQLSKVCDTNKEVNVYPFITSAALDIICETAMGIKMYAQEQKEGNEYTNAVGKLSQLVMQKIINPFLHIEFIYNRLAVSKRYKNSLKIVHDFTNKVIKDRKHVRSLEGKKEVTNDDAGIKKRLAFLDMLLDANENENNLTDSEIREEVDTFMFEGHDTTTVGICWTLLMIALHPEVQEKIHEELFEIFGDDKNEMATIHDLNRMNYLECVIKETLRLYPSVAVVSRNLNEDIEIGGYTIPKDCTVSIQIYMLHKDEKYFPDAEKFDPDRFLPENTEGRHTYAYVPFSAGMRNCIGQKFAVLEEKAVLSSILRNFKIKSLRKREDVRLISDLVLRPYEGIHLIIEKRV